MSDAKPVHCWLTDMDGVLVHEERAIPGAADFIAALEELRSAVPGADQQLDLHRPGPAGPAAAPAASTVPEESIWTSALATAKFLADQSAGGSAYVIGETGLTSALHDAGFVLTEADPDYVVLGETRTYSFRRSPRPSG